MENRHAGREKAETGLPPPLFLCTLERRILLQDTPASRPLRSQMGGGHGGAARDSVHGEVYQTGEVLD